MYNEKNQHSFIIFVSRFNFSQICRVHYYSLRLLRRSRDTMSTSKFLFKKVCVFCSRLFEAQKITTKYCSHACNLKHYKKKKRLQKIAADEEQTKAQNHILIKPPNTVQLVSAPLEFLSVKQASVLLGCTKKTIYQLIKTKRLHAINLEHRKTIIKRTDLDSLFNKPDL